MFADLEWINYNWRGLDLDYYCKSIKQHFLEMELNNVYYRETSEFESYENLFRLRRYEKRD